MEKHYHDINTDLYAAIPLSNSEISQKEKDDFDFELTSPFFYRLDSSTIRNASLPLDEITKINDKFIHEKTW